MQKFLVGYYASIEIVMMLYKNMLS